MTRDGALAVMIAVALLLLVAGVFAWWRRTKRDAGYAAPVGAPPADAVPGERFEGFYVATTVYGDPLERLAIRGMAFRSRVALITTDKGLVIALTGQPTLFIPAERLVAVAQSTVAIDRVVERDGLTRLTWRIDEDTVVDSYFRPQDASTKALTDALRPLIPASAPTGTDA